CDGVGRPKVPKKVPKSAAEGVVSYCKLGTTYIRAVSPPGLRTGNDLVLCQQGLHRFQLAHPGESPGVLVTALRQPLQRHRLVSLRHARIGLADGGYA